MDTTTTVNNVLLPRFDKVIKKAFHHGESYRWENMKRDASRKWNGKGRSFTFTLATKPEWGGGSRGEGGTMPTTDTETFAQGSVFPTQHYRQIGVTGLLEAVATGGDDSLTDEMVAKTENAVTNMKADLKRQAWQDGTGVLCMINFAAGYGVGTSTFACDAPGNWVDGAGAPLTQGCRYLRVGMRIAIGVAGDLRGTTGTAPIYRTIQSINRTASTFTVSVALGAGQAIANNALVVLASGVTANDNNFEHEMWGMLGAITDADPAAWGASSAALVPGFTAGYCGVLRATNPLFVSYVRRFGGAPQDFDSKLLPDTLSFLKELNDDVQVAKLITWHPSMTAEYAATLEGDIRQVPRKQIGGYDMPVFTYGGEIPIDEDGHCPVGHIFLDDPKRWELSILTDIGFAKFGDNGGNWRTEDTTDSKIARLVFRGNIFKEEPWASAMVKDIAVSRAPAF